MINMFWRFIVLWHVIDCNVVGGRAFKLGFSHLRLCLGRGINRRIGH